LTTQGTLVVSELSHHGRQAHSVKQIVSQDFFAAGGQGGQGGQGLEKAGPAHEIISSFEQDLVPRSTTYLVY